MQRQQQRRLRRHTVDADRTTLISLKGLDNYTPADESYSIAALSALEEQLDEALQDEERVKQSTESALAAARATLAAAGATSAAAERALHNAIRRAKSQVIAQHGVDSPLLHAIGLKRSSEYQRSTRVKSEPAKKR